MGRHRVLAIALPGTALDNSDAWSLLGSGASDVVRWDDRDPPVRAVAARLERWAEIERIMLSDTVRDTLIGDSPSWIAVLRQVVEVAAFTQTSVLLTGESGTGKELVARLIHGLDHRPDKGPFVVLDCTTVVPTLSGSEFFGHERGAFTGAVAARDGAFARANGGTLFLDEVGELPLTLQAELLRVIQEGSTSGSEATPGGTPRSGSFVRRTARSGMRLRAAGFVPTCITGSRPGDASCRRCVNGWTTSSRSLLIFCPR